MVSNREVPAFCTQKAEEDGMALGNVAPSIFQQSSPPLTLSKAENKANTVLHKTGVLSLKGERNRGKKMGEKRNLGKYFSISI